MKKLFLPILAVGLMAPAFAPIAATAGEKAERRFEHDGHVYSYTVTHKGDYRVISGVEERSGKAFHLRVGDKRVRGTVGSQQVNFTLRDVEPLGKPATTLASR
ncbi:hypothetical protein [Sphingopyxis sp. MWB1]|uniref:hypothetical protein n=1 Tax=Sphingopyxis sp. MWB1 TaxID=1537715 RepID=UPI00051A07CD|nr:hypothetical protein [Sphingopyxis sp. MWB1]